MKKLTPWTWAVLASIVPFGAAAGVSGAFAAHAAIVVITLSIFFGTLSIGRTSNTSVAVRTRLPAPNLEAPKV